jgi:DNA-binding transcriptional MerR regulator
MGIVSKGGGVPLQKMKKQLSQITFDFSAPAEEPVILPIVNETEPVVNEPEEVIEMMPAIAEDEKLSAKKIKESKTAITKVGKRGRKSLKDIAVSTAVINIPQDEELFKKQYYSIGDVAAMFNEKQSLIRYWEIEFDILQPRKNRKGDRFFRPVDIKNLEMIYDLLRRRKFTIEGAKDYLKKNKSVEEKYATIQSLEKIKNFLLELKASL